MSEPTIRDWPKAMKRKTAAAYCDVSEAAFIREVFSGRLPAAFTLGGRDHWHSDAIDAALRHLTGDDTMPPWERAFWDRNEIPEYRRKHRERYPSSST